MTTLNVVLEQCDSSGAVASTLRRLVPHIDTSCATIAGGLATSYRAFSVGAQRSGRDVGDLDFVVSSLGDVRQSVADDFRVAHWHPTEDYALLVDPETRCPVDIFCDRPGVAPTPVPFDRKPLLVEAAEEKLVALLRDCYRIRTADHAVPPKWLADARLVLNLVDQPILKALWARRRRADALADPMEELALIESLTTRYPERLAPYPDRKRELYTCAACRPRGRLVPMLVEESAALLGYIV